MAKLVEIEKKWPSDDVRRADFNRLFANYLSDEKFKYKLMKVDGFDYYFASKSGHVMRHRVSENTNELTVKARMSKKSIHIRAEGNIRLKEDNDIHEVHGTLQLLGLKHQVAIYKDCDIYFFDDGPAELSIVWYKVKHKGFKDHVFIEVEIHGLPRRISMKYLRKWSKILCKMFNLKEEDVSPDSLYEIYTGKKYRMV